MRMTFQDLMLIINVVNIFWYVFLGFVIFLHLVLYILDHICLNWNDIIFLKNVDWHLMLQFLYSLQ
jgi:hypothetical protein